MKQDKRRIVIDTNIFISFFLKTNSIPAQAVKAVLLHGTPLISKATGEELLRRLLSPKFDPYLGTDIHLRKMAFETLVKRSEAVSPDITITDCRDDKDNKFLELAVCGKADGIITGDKDLLALHPYRGIPIVTPIDFLKNYAKPQKSR